MDKFHMIVAIATIIVEKVNEGQWDLLLTIYYMHVHYEQATALLSNVN